MPRGLSSLVQRELSSILQHLVDAGLLRKGVHVLAPGLGPLPVVVVRPHGLVKVVGGRETKDMDVAAEVECEHDPDNALALGRQSGKGGWGQM